MPTPIRLVEFVRLCAAIYNSAVTSAAGFARSGFTQRRSGFQGAYFSRGNGQGADYVVTIAGTQPGDDYGADIVADAGFGGNHSRVAGVVVSVVGPILSAGPRALERQGSAAEQMVGVARGVATRRGDRVFITGHSLGGGIAQVVVARTGVAAVAIPAPTVTAVSGVVAAHPRADLLPADQERPDQRDIARRRLARAGADAAVQTHRRRRPFDPPDLRRAVALRPVQRHGQHGAARVGQASPCRRRQGVAAQLSSSASQYR